MAMNMKTFSASRSQRPAAGGGGLFSPLRGIGTPSGAAAPSPAAYRGAFQQAPASAGGGGGGFGGGGDFGGYGGFGGASASAAAVGVATSSTSGSGGRGGPASGGERASAARPSRRGGAGARASPSPASAPRGTTSRSRSTEGARSVHFTEDLVPPRLSHAGHPMMDAPSAAHTGYGGASSGGALRTPRARPASEDPDSKDDDDVVGEPRITPPRRGASPSPRAGYTGASDSATAAAMASLRARPAVVARRTGSLLGPVIRESGKADVSIFPQYDGGAAAAAAGGPPTHSIWRQFWRQLCQC